MSRQQKSCAVLAVLLSACGTWVGELPTRCELPGRDIPLGQRWLISMARGSLAWL